MTPSYLSIELTKIVNFMYQVNFRRIYVELSKPNGASFSLILTLTWRIYGKGIFFVLFFLNAPGNSIKSQIKILIFVTLQNESLLY